MLSLIKVWTVTGKLFDIGQSGKASLRRWHISEDLIINYLA